MIFASIQPEPNQWASILTAGLWPLVVVATVALLSPILRNYLTFLSRRQALYREEQRVRLEQQRAASKASWAYSESASITETVATIVAAAVAARLVKKGGTVDSYISYEKLRSIVRRMTQSINLQETRNLQGAKIAWVHRVKSEDYYEQHVLENLGATVCFFTTNEALLEYVKQNYRDIVAIISNRSHWLTNDDQKVAGFNADAVLDLLEKIAPLRQQGIDTPVVIYSRSVDEKYGDTLTAAGARMWTDLPEVMIHEIFNVANSLRWEEQRDAEHKKRTVSANGVAAQKVLS